MSENGSGDAAPAKRNWYSRIQILVGCCVTLLMFTAIGGFMTNDQQDNGNLLVAVTIVITWITAAATGIYSYRWREFATGMIIGVPIGVLSGLAVVMYPFSQIDR